MVCVLSLSHESGTETTSTSRTAWEHSFKLYSKWWQQSFDETSDYRDTFAIMIIWSPSIAILKCAMRLSPSDITFTFCNDLGTALAEGVDGVSPMAHGVFIERHQWAHLQQCWQRTLTITPPSQCMITNNSSGSFFIWNSNYQQLRPIFYQIGWVGIPKNLKLKISLTVGVARVPSVPNWLKLVLN